MAVKEEVPIVEQVARLMWTVVNTSHGNPDLVLWDIGDDDELAFEREVAERIDALYKGHRESLRAYAASLN